MVTDNDKRFYRKIGQKVILNDGQYVDLKESICMKMEVKMLPRDIKLENCLKKLYNNAYQIQNNINKQTNWT